MSFNLPELPYGFEDLEPYISAKTLEFHYGKHHKAYVDNLNKLIQGTFFEDLSLEDIILQTANKLEFLSIFNNAAQVWNHTFFWHCLKNSSNGPSDSVKERLVKDFGSFDAFKEEFKAAALAQFGSGWAWLVLKEGALSIMKTSNADLPMTSGAKALLTCDVWEHSYYLDYQNRRGDYVECFLKNLVNWDFVAKNLEA
ncbi:MAG TPA: superoxide dismutase [Alphaproteobacteria bacterium]|nr:superoxide dismutase [Alphaproteobacteria bacterium]